MENNKKIQKIQGDYCSYLATKFDSNYDDEQLEGDNSDTKGLCRKFMNNCVDQGGAPQCYSGFCDIQTGCIDCPMGPVELGTKISEIEPVVCGGHGKCRLGWKNQYQNGGNGYCECDKGSKGLACQFKSDANTPGKKKMIRIKINQSNSC